MKPLPLLLLCALAGSGGSLVVSSIAPTRSRAAEDTNAPDIARLSARLAELGRRAEELERAVAKARLAPTAPQGRTALGGVDAAVERWMKRHAPEPAAPATLDPGDDVDRAVDHILSSDVFGDDELGFWKELRESGAIDAVLARMEELVERSPYDPELRVALAQVLVQKSFERGAGPEREVLLDRAEETYAGALELDEENWRARYGRAVTLSSRAAFLGKTPEAIGEFERLIAQQERSPSEPRFAASYYFLGNLYAQSGESDKALEAWRRGLARFPNDARLAEQVSTYAELEGGGR